MTGEIDIIPTSFLDGCSIAAGINTSKQQQMM